MNDSKTDMKQNYTPAPDLLKDRVILVTGAGDGIGRAAALAYAAHGATVILLGRTTKKLEAVYDEIEAQGSPQPIIYPMDLEQATAENYEHFSNAINEELGRLDGILHNAGLLGKRTPLANYDINTWSQVMHVNVTAPLILTQALLPLMQQSEDASIIFTSSGVGRKGRAFWGAYAVSKFATEGLMETLADELDGVTNIRVNCINPGATRTSMRSQAYPAEDPRNNPLPEDIMPTYLYLMGPDGKSTNGQSLNAQ